MWTQFCIFESLQLADLYVGGLLYGLWSQGEKGHPSTFQLIRKCKVNTQAARRGPGISRGHPMRMRWLPSLFLQCIPNGRDRAYPQAWLHVGLVTCCSFVRAHGGLWWVSETSIGTLSQSEHFYLRSYLFFCHYLYKKKNCFDEWPTVSLPRMKLKCVSKMHALEIRDLRNRVERNFHEWGCPTFLEKILEWAAISLSREFFLTQGLNLSLLHWQVDSVPAEPPGEPKAAIDNIYINGCGCILSVNAEIGTSYYFHTSQNNILLLIFQKYIKYF